MPKNGIAYWQEKPAFAKSTSMWKDVWELEFEGAFKSLGWTNLEDAMSNNGLLLADENGNLSPVQSYNFFKKDDDAATGLIQESLNGRLFIKSARNDKIRQIKTTQSDAGLFTMEYSEPMDALTTFVKGEETIVGVDANTGKKTLSGNTDAYVANGRIVDRLRGSLALSGTGWESLEEAAENDGLCMVDENGEFSFVLSVGKNLQPGDDSEKFLDAALNDRLYLVKKGSTNHLNDLVGVHVDNVSSYNAELSFAENPVINLKDNEPVIEEKKEEVVEEAKKEKRVLDKTASAMLFNSNLASTIQQKLNESGTGWKKLDEAVANKGFVMFDEEGNPTSIYSLAAVYVPPMNDQFADAALNDRLFIRKKGSDKLVRVQIDKFNSLEAEISFAEEPERTFGVGEQAEAEAKDESIMQDIKGEAVAAAAKEDAPPKPSWWEHIAAWFSNYYKERINEYNNYEKRKAEEALLEEFASNRDPDAVEKEQKSSLFDGDALAMESDTAFGRAARKEAAELKNARDNEVIREEIQHLERVIGENSDPNTRKPLDSKAPRANMSQEARYMEDLYYNGMYRRMELAETAFAGKIEKMDDKKKADYLGEALVGEWLRRTMKQLNATKGVTYENNPVYKAMREDPTFINQMKVDMLSSPKAQALLNGKSSEMLNTVGGPYHFSGLVDDAIKHVDKLNKERQEFKENAKTNTNAKVKQQGGKDLV